MGNWYENWAKVLANSMMISSFKQHALICLFQAWVQLRITSHHDALNQKDKFFSCLGETRQVHLESGTQGKTSQKMSALHKKM